MRSRTKIIRTLLPILLSVYAFPAFSQKSASTYSRPKAIPESANTNFDASLRCMDDLLLRSQIGSGSNIHIGQLTKEEAVGATTRDMIAAAVAKMSEKSRVFNIYVDTPDSELTREKLDNTAVIVGGSITSFEKNLGSTTKSAGLNIGLLGFGANGLKSESIITLTLYLKNRNLAVIPLTTQSISMTIRSKSKGGDISGNIGLLGGFLEMEFSRDEGPMQAVRAMIELSLIQSIGAWAGVPFQRCLAIRQTDPTAIQAAQRAFEKLKPQQQLARITEGLIARGLYSGPADGIMNAQLRQAISEFQVNQSLPSLGIPTFEVFYRLYGEAYGAPKAIGVPTVIPNSFGLKIAPYGPNFLANGYDEPLILNDERASFAISTVKMAHVTCFYTDSQNRTARIFPNRQRPNDLLMPRDTLILPGPSDIYTIVAQETNKPEYVTCAASSQPTAEWLPPNLQQDLQSRIRLPGAADIARELKLANANSSVEQFSFRSVCRLKDGGFNFVCPP